MYEKSDRAYYLKNKIKILAKQKIYCSKIKEKRKLYQYLYSIKTREKRLKYYKVYRETHVDLCNRAKMLWAKKHPEKTYLASIKWARKNKDKVKLIRKKCLSKKRGTLEGRINHIFAERMRASLFAGKGGESWNKLCEYSTKELIDKLFGNPVDSKKLALFMDGELHIDHKTPLSWFKYKSAYDDNFKRAWSLENLQLLDKVENIKKNDSYVGDVLLLLQQFNRGN
jgi:5-methylcytosine-specific restriction endonuclease McrA